MARPPWQPAPGKVSMARPEGPLAAMFTDMLGHIIIVVGVVINLMGCLKFWVAANRVSTVWFIGCLCVFVWPFFLLAHFSKAWRPFALWLAGAVIVSLGIYLRSY